MLKTSSWFTRYKIFFNPAKSKTKTKLIQGFHQNYPGFKPPVQARHVYPLHQLEGSNCNQHQASKVHENQTIYEPATGHHRGHSLRKCKVFFFTIFSPKSDVSLVPRHDGVHQVLLLAVVLRRLVTEAGGGEARV